MQSLNPTNGTKSSERHSPTDFNQSNRQSDGQMGRIKYYYSSKNPKLGKDLNVNIDNAWNPVDSYIYNPTTQNSIFQRSNKFISGQSLPQTTPPHHQQQNHLSGQLNLPTGNLNTMHTPKNYENNLLNIRMALNALDNHGNSGTHGVPGANGPNSNIKTYQNLNDRDEKQNRYDIYGSYKTKEQLHATTSMTTTETIRMVARGNGIQIGKSNIGNNKNLIVELYDNETPKLCDHGMLENTINKMRPCSPLESYVSRGNDMVIIFSQSVFLYLCAFIYCVCEWDFIKSTATKKKRFSFIQ